MNPLLIILGPTASGKTHLATRVADCLGGEIISADSRQVYRNMDIGTGKDLDEYIVNGSVVPYHLINIRDAGDRYNVNEYQKDFYEALMQIGSRNTVPVLCGGTGFYIYSVLKGHAFSSIPVNDNLRLILEGSSNEALLEKFQSFVTPYTNIADTSTRKRIVRAIEISEYLTNNPEFSQADFGNKPDFDQIIFGLNPLVDLRRERISKRLKLRLENGLISEVEELLKSGLLPEQLIYYGLEYKFVTLYLTGEMSYHEMSQRLESEIHRFAKRQMTFFRKMEKDGIQINWLDPSLSVEQQIKVVETGYKEIFNKQL